MQLEDQVTSLELSQKLKELGCSQESLFYWVPGILQDNGDITVNDNEKMTWSILNAPEKLEGELYFHFNLTYIDYDSADWEVEHKKRCDELKNKICSAYTVAELGEMLPPYIEVKDTAFWLEAKKHSVKDDSQYSIQYISYKVIDRVPTENIFAGFYAEKEAEVRAETLIYLIEKGLLKWNWLTKICLN